ncbi:MAG: ATP-dependent Clp protease adaptor ClpS [Deltaproteobacteria bacterium]|nr:ATP-dependent Clp protease adaptor ClpS [Deltaproteobacteria bacterium]MCW5804425.1 ATP-dependent Clp protease adaptor ClpS [Deltaproteobacteria bacterium]
MDVGYLALVAGGVGVYWWRYLKTRTARGPKDPLFAPDAEIAMHVARHEARSRSQPLSALHVLYGLVQDEAFAAAIARVGGDAACVEDKLLADLGAPPDRDARPAEVGEMLNHAVVVARHNERLATCTDVWAYLAPSPDARRVLTACSVDPVALLYVLVHGIVDGAPSALVTREADVVLRNDDYTTREFVVELLRDVFDLPEAHAMARMEAAHGQGSAVLGRFAGDTARHKVAEARSRARAQGFPLRIEAESR